VLVSGPPRLTRARHRQEQLPRPSISKPFAFAEWNAVIHVSNELSYNMLRDFMLP